MITNGATSLKKFKQTNKTKQKGYSLKKLYQGLLLLGFLEHEWRW
jgi:hypothetical protein